MSPSSLKRGLLAGLLLILIARPVHALNVRTVQVSTPAGQTCLTILFDVRPATFSAFSLANPGRIIVDLPAFTWMAGKITRPADSLVVGLRQGLLQPGTSRIVFDLRGPVTIKSAVIARNRLVIRFTAATAAEAQRSQHKMFKPATDIAREAGSANTEDTPQVGGVVMLPDKTPKTPSIGPPPVGEKPLIIIDAGHGGVDPGTQGAGGVIEKNVTLAVAHALRDQLVGTGHYKVLLTREGDTYLYLPQRVAFARQHHGDLFISLHADSSPGGEAARGASVYTLSENASDAETAKLAAKENRADQVAGMDLSHQDDDVAGILVDLAMRDTMNQSNFLANTVAGNLQGHDIPLLERPHRAAGFAVLKDPDVPSILVEMGFLSNSKQAQALSDPAFQRRLAVALNAALDAYFRKVRGDVKPQ